MKIGAIVIPVSLNNPRRAMRVALSALAALILPRNYALLFKDANADDYVVFVGEEDHPVVDTISIGGIASGVAVNHSTGRVYVTNLNDGTVSVIDGGTNTVIATVTVGNVPFAVAINRTTNRIYVTNQNSNSVSVIDGTTQAVMTVTVGTLPTGVAVNPATNRIYLTNSFDYNVSVITNTYTDTLTVTDSISTTFTAAPPEDRVDGGGGGGTTVFLNPTFSQSYFETRPLERVQVQSVGFTDGAGNPISSAAAGQQATITVSFRNLQQTAQDYAVIVPIIDQDGFTVAVSRQQGTIGSGASSQVSTTWTPAAGGAFNVRVFVWDGIDSVPDPLSQMTQTSLQVS